MIQNTFEILQHICGRNPHHSHALASKPSVPLFISLWSIAKVMRTTIDFHCKAGRRAETVENIRTRRMLVAKAEAESG